MILRAFWLPTVPQNHIVNKVVLALQAEGHPFEPDTAHQLLSHWIIWPLIHCQANPHDPGSREPGSQIQVFQRINEEVTQSFWGRSSAG